MLLWSKIWSVLDNCFLWLLDSESDSLVRDVAVHMPDDPREQTLLVVSVREEDHERTSF